MSEPNVQVCTEMTLKKKIEFRVWGGQSQSAFGNFGKCRPSVLSQEVASFCFAADTWEPKMSSHFETTVYLRWTLPDWLFFTLTPKFLGGL